MTAFRAVVRDRRIEIPASEELADGTHVVVEVASVYERVGLAESEWDDSPEGIADWVKWLDSLEPFVFFRAGTWRT